MNRNLYYKLMEKTGGYWLLRLATRKRPKILMYHRITNDPETPGVSPEIFSEQMKYLKRHFNVVPILDLIEMLKKKNVTNNCVALTFDDGHYDFYKNAWPILKSLDFPCSLYVTTKFVDRDCWLWPDMVKHILLSTHLTEFNDERAGELKLTKDLVNKNWSILANIALNLDSDTRKEYISSLATNLNVELTESPSDKFSAVNWAQLEEMSREGLDIGSHTVTHRILSQLPMEELKYELEQSKAILEERLSIKVEGICYPNGTITDYNETTVQESKILGYSYGLVAHDNGLTDIWRLGRQPGAFSFEEFKASVCNARLRDWKK